METSNEPDHEHLERAADRRGSDTLNVMSGVGDERRRSLYTRAVAFVGTFIAAVAVLARRS